MKIASDFTLKAVIYLSYQPFKPKDLSLSKASLLKYFVCGFSLSFLEISKSI
jgi:hypothetical protein